MAMSPPMPPMMPPPKDYSPEAYVMGVALATLGTLSASCGHVLYRRSAMVESELPLLKRWRWMLASFMVAVVLSVANGVALALVPLSLVAPFAGLSMVWSVWFGHCGCCGLNEPLRCQDAALAGVVLLGVIGVSVVESLVTRPPLSEQDLLDAAGRPGFIVFWLFAVLVATLWLTLPAAEAIRRRFPVIGAITSAFLGATCASLTESFAKFTTTAIGSMLNHSSKTVPPAWFFLVALGGLASNAPLDLLLLSRTITGASLVLAVPLYQSLVVILAATAGSAVFGEAANYSSLQWGGFLTGIGLVVIGVSALGYTNAERDRRRAAHDDPSNNNGIPRNPSNEPILKEAETRVVVVESDGGST